jgi:hypothetical protein
VSDTTITIQDLSRIMAMTARSQPAVAYGAIDALAMRLFDHRLFTVTRSLLETVDASRSRTRRGASRCSTAARS